MKQICFFFCLTMYASCTLSGDGETSFACDLESDIQGYWSLGDPESFAIEFIDGSYLEHQGGADTCSYDIQDCEAGAMVVRCDNFSVAYSVQVLSDDIILINDDRFLREIEPCNKFDILEGTWESVNQSTLIFSPEPSQGARGIGTVAISQNNNNSTCDYLIDCLGSDMYLSCSNGETSFFRIRIVSDEEIIFGSGSWRKTN